MYVYKYILTKKHAQIHTCKKQSYTYIYYILHADVYRYINKYIHTHIHKHTYIQTYIHKCLHTYINTHTHKVHTSSYITYVHSYIHVHKCVLIFTHKHMINVVIFYEYRIYFLPLQQKSVFQLITLYSNRIKILLSLIGPKCPLSDTYSYTIIGNFTN